jgi:NAD(P)-dependent dehydrogenase (short-subunit alcohol dehydrogenase family)/acyl carrier protein
VTSTHNGTGPPMPVAAAQPPASPGTSNGNGHLVGSPAAGWIEATPQPAVEPPPLTGDRVADVMLQYQHVMQQFLETERSVMLGYLGAARHDPGSRQAARLSPRAALTPLPVPTPVQQLAAPALPVAPPALPVAPPAAPAPAPVAAPPPAAAPISVSDSPVTTDLAVVLTHEQIEARLLDVVSERTGYPTDMLSLDADLEGDLGIDSIKRVEVAGTFTQTLAEQQRAAIDMEQLTSSRTLREVIAVLEQGIRQPAPAPPDPPAPPPAEPAEAIVPFESRPVETERIGRFVVHPTSAPAITATAGLHPAGVVAIVDDGSGPLTQLAVQLAGRDETVLITRASLTGGARSASRLVEQLRREHGVIKALVFPADDDGSGGVATLLALVQGLASDLQRAADGGGAAVIGVTRLGGAFGLDASAASDPGNAGGSADTDQIGATSGQRALSGFLKTLAIEWPAVRTRTVDLAPTADPALAGGQLAAELYAADGLVEVGYRGDDRLTLAVSPATLGETASSAPIDPDCVVLVTGGARGITAATAFELARRHRPTLVLVGRTTLGEEPVETSGITDPAELRRTLIAVRRRDGAELSPVLVEADLRRLLAQREVAGNLAALRATGARVDYRRCDVSEPDAFGALIDDLYATHGRIDGVIHGAGVIEDQLIADKSADSLARVLAVKVGAARTLAQRLRPESLRFLVLFSSVSGRFGNRGQADYAAASEALAQLANELDRSWPGRVVAIDWGPWSGTGMVSEALEREFERRGVALIDVEAGSRILADELARGHAGEAELVIGAASGLSESEPAVTRLPLLAGCETSERGPTGAITFTRDLDLDHDRYLGDHRVDGQPVFPFAAAMELMAESAVAAAPGRSFSGLSGIRLLKGIVVPDGERFAVRVSATPLPSADEIELTIGAADGSRLHYRAIASFRHPEATPSDPARPVALPQLPAFPLPLRDAYRDLLFHGPIFQRIGAIAGMDGRGATAQLHPSVPGDCMSDSEAFSWELDPVLLDSALQAQVLWARLQWDVTLLPAEIAAYERFDAPRPGELVHHELRIQGQSTPPMCHADHWFFGADGRLLATLEGVLGVGTRALNRLAATPA